MNEGSNYIIMRFLLLLGLSIVLVTGFLVSITSPVFAQSHCTASNPCQQICGDHICAPGEYARMQAAAAQSQIGNNTSSAPQTATTGNMTVTGPSTGTVVAGVVSYTATASDGTIVIVRTGHPIPGQQLSVGVAFYTANKNTIANQNYAIIISQDGIPIFSKTLHSDSGIDSLTTPNLSSSDPINVQVTLNGIGPSSADPSTWTGVKGEVINFSQTTAPTKPTPPPVQPPTANITITTPTSNNTTVPEFGSVAPIILVIAVISIVVITKTRAIPRL